MTIIIIQKYMARAVEINEAFRKMVMDDDDLRSIQEYTQI